jgi:hypothetical protein
MERKMETLNAHGKLVFALAVSNVIGLVISNIYEISISRYESDLYFLLIT